jgi:hypothetical protein
MFTPVRLDHIALAWNPVFVSTIAVEPCRDVVMPAPISIAETLSLQPRPDHV